MLSFEFKQVPGKTEPEELEVYCDLDGLQSLIAQLQFMKEGRTEHVHLMAGAWGGTHLENTAQVAGNSSVHHVKILLQDKRNE